MSIFKFNHRHILSRALIMLVVPILVVLTGFFIYSIKYQRERVTSSINESASHCNAAILSQLNANVSKYETLLKTMAYRTELQQTILATEQVDISRAVDSLRTIKGEINRLLPNTLMVYVVFGGKIIPDPLPPRDSEIFEESVMRDVLNCEENKEGFCWSRPFIWRANVPAVAGFWRISSPTTSNSLGVVLSLADLSEDILDVAYSYPSLSGALIIDDVSKKLWFDLDSDGHVFSSLFSAVKHDAAVREEIEWKLKTLLQENAVGTTVEVNANEFIAFVNKMKSGNLKLVLFFDQAKLLASVPPFSIVQTLMLLAFIILLALLAFFYASWLRNAFSELTLSVRTISQGDENAVKPASLPAEADELWHEFDNYFHDYNLRLLYSDEKEAEYRSTILKLTELTDLLPDGYLLSREDGTIVECNKAIVSISGYSHDELNSMKITSLLRREQREKDISGDSSFNTFRPLLVQKDETTIPVGVIERQITIGYENFRITLVRDMSLEDDLKQSVLSLNAQLDTQRHDSSKELEGFRQYSRDMMQSLLEGVLRLDGAGNIIFCNSAASDLFLYPDPRELFGINIFSGLGFADSSDKKLRQFLASTSEIWKGSVSFIRFDGSSGSADVKCIRSDKTSGETYLFLTDTSVISRLHHEIASIRRETATLLAEHERDMRETRQQLIEYAHSAGMVQVAGEVLHNIGNAINSVGVRLNEASDMLNSVQFDKKLSYIAELDAQELVQNWERYHNYLLSLVQALAESRMKITENTLFIREKLSHITEIISLHATFAMIRGIIETIQISKLVLDAIEMNRETMSKRKISHSYQFGQVPEVKVEKNKLLQVLVNVVKNAIEAIDAAQSENKEIKVETSFDPTTRMIEIRVTDSGIGFSKETGAQLFGFGFSTKKAKGGSGFGLHSSFNLMKAMGGSITAHSEGVGMGAAFTIKLPLEPKVESDTEF